MNLLTASEPLMQFANPENGWTIVVHAAGSEFLATVTFHSGKTAEFRGTQAHAFNSAVQFALQNPNYGGGKIRVALSPRDSGARNIGKAVENNVSDAQILADIEKDLAQ
jgi:hypothetical protein